MIAAIQDEKDFAAQVKTNRQNNRTCSTGRKFDAL